MHLRTSLTVAAAVVAGLVGITATATASNPTGSAINYTRVNGSTSGNVAISGDFVSGTASFGGGTFTCSDGGVGGTAAAGATSGGVANQAYSSLDIICETPLGTDAEISIGSNCATGAFSDSNVHDGTVDTGTGTKFSRVDGTVTLANSCGTVTAGPCVANVSGSVTAAWDENIASSKQHLILNGTGFTLSNQNFFCFGLLTGGVTLNNIDFAMDASGGGVDFRTTA